MVKSNSW